MKKFLILTLLLFLASCSTQIVDDNRKDMDMGHMEGMDQDTMMGSMHGNSESDYRQMCEDAGYEWMLMKPTKDGKIIKEEKPCFGCMVEDIEHVCDKTIFMEMTGKSPTAEMEAANLRENSKSAIKFRITEPDGHAAEPVMSHEQLFHAIIIREDFSSFSHVHPKYQKEGIFELNHTFTRGGKYIVGTDYATKDGSFSKKFIIMVEGDQTKEIDLDFSRQKNFAGYDVKLQYSDLLENKESLMNFYIEKDKMPVKDLSPYLAAPMHIAIVKDDLSEFIHSHGEVHGSESDMDGMDNSMEHEIPSEFGPGIEAHVTFPSKGIYNIFGEFKHEGNIIVISFMVEVK